MTRRRTHQDFARRAGRTRRELTGLVRRMAIAASDAVSWALTGHRDESGHVETASAEVFAHVGFASRPAESDAAEAAEAIVVAVDASANHTVIVATRDRATERAVIDQIGLEAGETLVFNASCAIKLTRDGDVLIGAPGKPFQAIALADHTHAAPAITGQASYVDGANARTGPPDQVSQHVKVT